VDFVYCEEDGLEESCNICEGISISAVELTAISEENRLTDGKQDALKGTGR
jgi:hypothetical protein